MEQMKLHLSNHRSMYKLYIIDFLKAEKTKRE